MAMKRKRGSTWHYTVKRAGVLPKPLNLSFPDEAEGDAYVARLEQLLDAGIIPPEFAEQTGAIVTVGDAIREYRKAVSIGKADRPVLDLLVGEMGTTSVTRVDYTWVDRFVRNLKQKNNLAPSTIRHRVGAIARCYDWLMRKGDVPGNPWRLLPKKYANYTEADQEVLAAVDLEAKQDVSRDRRLEGDEEKKIKAILSGENTDHGLTLKHRAALEFMLLLDLQTGMRMREVFTLWTNQFDLDKATIFLDKTKNGDRRQVPLFDTALTMCRNYLASIPEGPAFPWVDWENFSDAELDRVTSLLSRQFNRVFATAGAKGLTFHDLRHEATCRLYEKTNFTDVEIAKILGWSSLRMALRYANLRGSTLATRVKGL